MDLKTEYYDLGLLHRDETRDQVTIDAANATKRLGVAVKCATITPNAPADGGVPPADGDVEEPQRHHPGHFGRHRLPRAHCPAHGIHPVVKNWEAPITIARHAYGDMYKAVDMVTAGAGHRHPHLQRARAARRRPSPFRRSAVPPCVQGQHNTEKTPSRAFARSCFQYAINQRQDLWFSTKDTISKVYDGEFKRIFEEEYETDLQGGV